jgi:hypothetical protein
VMTVPMEKIEPACVHQAVGPSGMRSTGYTLSSTVVRTR